MDTKDARCRGDTPTALHLEQLTLGLYDAYDRRDFDKPLRNFICPTFRNAPRSPTSTAPDQRMQKHRNATFSSTGYDAFVELMNLEYFQTDFRMKVTEVSADVDEDAGVARVWKVGRVIGLPEGQERESVTCLEWKRQANGDWLCVMHFGLSGVPMGEPPLGS
ncbi:hypothetical protein M409DRAFT_18995 [Zasmidium cellare ATCC 36951]|uniref:SnoaL-like domain-containing protein n=1 Tax=Zasmidium cellare ATCC 36951 TaxID=1080233 RepID=A0A6A6CYR6_ZASCE|nr:uncharacterized protein M409DRAFT_18995 [Zasmidium cellare ATCC 36951]KAF2171022.1 hypothetical protein M409DRAFT_18995 [Zasmidium cellare ATCC 36951]